MTSKHLQRVEGLHELEELGEQAGIVERSRARRRMAQLPSEPFQITGIGESLQALQWDPVAVGVELFAAQEANGELGECRKIWERLLEYSHPKYRAVAVQHEFRALKVIYDDAEDDVPQDILELAEDDD